MSTRLALRIQERFDKLSPSERKLAALLLERQDDILTYSATEMAELAGTSKATAARLFRSLGYSDFNEVRLQAREERNRTAPFEQRRAETSEPAGSRSIGNHLQAEIAALTRTFEDLRPDRIGTAARLIAEAPRVWLLAFGMDEGFARSARLRLARLRPDVQLLALQPGNWGEDLAMTGPRDALLLFLTGQRPRVLKPMLGYARTTRMQVVTICEYPLAAFAARHAAVVLPCHAAAPQAGAAATAIASMTRLLASAVADEIGAASGRRSELIAEIDEELDHLE